MNFFILHAVIRPFSLVMLGKCKIYFVSVWFPFGSLGLTIFCAQNNDCNNRGEPHSIAATDQKKSLYRPPISGRMSLFYDGVGSNNDEKQNEEPRDLGRADLLSWNTVGHLLHRWHSRHRVDRSSSGVTRICRFLHEEKSCLIYRLSNLIGPASG